MSFKFSLKNTTIVLRFVWLRCSGVFHSCYVGIPLVFCGVPLVFRVMFSCSATVSGCSAVPPVFRVPAFRRPVTNITDPKLCSLITNLFKPPRLLTSKKMSSPLDLFGLKSFHRFFIADARMEPIILLALRFICTKTILHKDKSCKNIQINIKMFQWEHTKRIKYYFIDS